MVDSQLVKNGKEYERFYTVDDTAAFACFFLH